MEAWFAQYGKVNAVRKRMTEAKVFKVRLRLRPPRSVPRPAWLTVTHARVQNSVFAEFATMEELEAFLALDPKPKFGETEVVTMSKSVRGKSPEPSRASSS
jgi:hypothetical protein